MVTKDDYVTVEFKTSHFIEAIKWYDSLSVLEADLKGILSPGDTPESVICRYAAKEAIREWLSRAVPANDTDRVHYDFRIGNVRIQVVNDISQSLPEPINDATITVNKASPHRHAFIFTRTVPVTKNRQTLFQTLQIDFKFENKVNNDRQAMLAIKFQEHYRGVTIVGFSNLNTFLETAKHLPAGFNTGTGHKIPFECYVKEISQLTPIKQVVYHYENLTGHKVS